MRSALNMFVFLYILYIRTEHYSCRLLSSRGTPWRNTVICIKWNNDNSPCFWLTNSLRIRSPTLYILSELLRLLTAPRYFRLSISFCINVHSCSFLWQKLDKRNIQEHFYYFIQYRSMLKCIAILLFTGLNLVWCWILDPLFTDL